jgi:(p)ppGpp synthase/HD superfamily hydrolase
MRQGWLDDPDMTNNNATKSLLLDSVLSDQDLEQIEMYWDRLLPTVNYLGTVQVARIYKALCVAYRAHLHQRRKSGEPFIIHVRIVLYCIVLHGTELN